MKRLIGLVILIFFLTPGNIQAHPGNTAADGCHYCRTRCDYWGVPWNERHCHGGTVNANTEPQQIAPSSVSQPTSTPTSKPTVRPTVIPSAEPVSTPISSPSSTPTATFSALPSPTNQASPTIKATSNKSFSFWKWLFSLFVK